MLPFILTQTDKKNRGKRKDSREIVVNLQTKGCESARDGFPELIGIDDPVMNMLLGQEDKKTSQYNKY